MTSQNADAAGNGPQACPECGTPPTPGQSFCDGCGAVLTWTSSSSSRSSSSSSSRSNSSSKGSDAASGASAAPAAAAEVPAKPDGTASAPAEAAPDRSGDVLSSAAGARVPAAREASPDETPTEPLPPATAAAPAAAPSTESAASDGEDAATARARALLVPVADAQQQEVAPSIAPVLPGRPVAARPTAQAPGAELGDEGGVPCPWCGTANRPDRHFCRRCAMTMEGRPEDPPKLAWWRRLPGFGPRRNPWAGERPRLRSNWSQVIRWVVAAAVVAAVITLAVNGGSMAQAVGDHFASRSLIPPDTSKISASNSYPQHGPELAFDEHNNTWWGPGFTGDDAGRWIQAGFDQPENLLDVIISPGVSTNASDLDSSALPQTLQATVTDSNGKVQTTLLTLNPNVGPQTLPLRYDNVVSVRFTIESAYNASPTKQVAIAEIEFFGRSHGGGS
ncbi:zinc ribbon domain-containing protein [Streptacidiphilus sp. MAP5-3]|uniref:zinc ribbon domain-containing protein n=1 Tax=unclassified Streptacidiphilus TaxID=2643834 RepID=UPI003518D725